jgi:hypothetical protein
MVTEADVPRIEQEINQIKDKFNQAMRVRYVIIQRKIALWNRLSEITKKSPEDQKRDIDLWLKDFITLSKKEASLIDIFRRGIDIGYKYSSEADKQMDELVARKVQLPYGVRDLAYFLKYLFKKSGNLITQLEKRIIKESKLYEKEGNKRLGASFYKKLHNMFKKELHLQLKLIRFKDEHAAQVLVEKAD